MAVGRRMLLAFCILTPISGAAGARADNASTFAIETMALTTSTPLTGKEQIPAELLRPVGDGPFPAIVIAHDCSGLGPRSSGAPRRWAAILAAQGYVILMPDSFSTRGFPDGLCTAPAATPEESLRKANTLQQVYDAYAALAWLRQQRFIDGAHVGIMGGSHGGSATLAAMAQPPSDRAPLAEERRHGFAAGVALYPGCAAWYGNWSVERAGGTLGPVTLYKGAYQANAPLLILMGAEDDWTPAEHCQALVDYADQSILVRLKVYPGALHSFDSLAPQRFVTDRRNVNAPGGRGATTGGNLAAWADAIKEVTRFFATTLKSEEPR